MSNDFLNVTKKKKLNKNKEKKKKKDIVFLGKNSDAM